MQEKLNITNAIINGEEQPAVNARELWQKLKSKRKFADWIQDRLADFEEGMDFTVHKIVNGENKGRFAAIEYTLTLDTAKHLCMLERNEQGKRIRQYFIEFEKGARKVIENMVKDYEENVKFCRDVYAQKCMEKTPCHVVATPRDLKSSTIEMLDMINRKIIAGEEVDKDVLQYAWHVGKLFNREVRRNMLPDALTDFVVSFPAGRFTRGDVYKAYCNSCSMPVSARQFWPAVRVIRPCQEVREAYKRFVVFE